MKTFNEGDKVIFTNPLDGTKEEKVIKKIIKDRGPEPLYQLQYENGMVSGILWKADVLTLKTK